MKRVVLTVALLIGLAAPAWTGFYEGITAYSRGDYLAVFLGIGIALGQSLNQGDVKGKETPAPTEQRQEAPSAPSVSPAIPAETGSGSVYSPDCDSPKSRNEADLCEQRRMADAAYETVEWVRKQYTATIGEIIALVIAIFVATLAVAVAFRANRISKDSAQRQLRAYVVVDPSPKWAAVGDVNKPTAYALTLRWENSGATPARRGRSFINTIAFDEEIPADFDYPDAPRSRQPGKRFTERSHIGPKKHVGITVSIPKSDVEAAERGDKRVFVWSWIEYNDIFKGTPRRRTEVCFDLQISDGARICTPIFTGPFNGADEDCLHKAKT